MVTVVPEIEHTDGVVLVLYETARPEDALATGLNAKVPLDTKDWVAGDCVLKVIVCAVKHDAVGLLLLRGAAKVATKSLPLLSVSVQPPALRKVALLVFGAGAKVVSTQLAVLP